MFRGVFTREFGVRYRKRGRSATFSLRPGFRFVERRRMDVVLVSPIESKRQTRDILMLGRENLCAGELPLQPYAK